MCVPEPTTAVYLRERLSRITMDELVSVTTVCWNIDTSFSVTPPSPAPTSSSAPAGAPLPSGRCSSCRACAVDTTNMPPLCSSPFAVVRENTLRSVAAAVCATPDQPLPSVLAWFWRAATPPVHSPTRQCDSARRGERKGNWGHGQVPSYPHEVPLEARTVQAAAKVCLCLRVAV